MEERYKGNLGGLSPVEARSQDLVIRYMSSFSSKLIKDELLMCITSNCIPKSLELARNRLIIVTQVRKRKSENKSTSSATTVNATNEVNRGESSNNRPKLCYFFHKHGECKKGDECEFYHNPKDAKVKDTKVKDAKKDAKNPKRKRAMVKTQKKVRLFYLYTLMTLALTVTADIN